MHRYALSFSVLAFLVLPAPAVVASAGTEMADAARALLATLSDEQQANMVFDFTDSERLDWHYVPRRRAGLSLKSMTPEQRLLTQQLLATGLSQRGMMKAAGVMSLESVLAVLENNPARRDPENYFVTIFGSPESTPWGWRFEGHHLALNFTLVAPQAAPVVTPNFMGSNPAEVRQGPRTGYRILNAEEELARALLDELTDAQRAKTVIFADAPREIFNEPGRNETQPAGIPWTELNTDQQRLLLDLVYEYAYRFRPDVAEHELERLRASGLDRLHFAWAGSTERGRAHYYRVQSGTFVLEYDNTQNNANHIHSVWRDFDREFGADLLAEHYRVAHAD